jgi:hypothetical protein
MQRTIFIRPEKQERVTPAQKTVFIKVPGKRANSTRKEPLPPVVPVVDNRKWYTVSQVRDAIARNKLSIQFRLRALSLAEAYEKCFTGPPESSPLADRVRVLPVLGATAQRKKDRTENQTLVDVVTGKILRSQTITLPNKVVRAYEAKKTKVLGPDVFNGEPKSGFTRAKQEKPTNVHTPASYSRYLHAASAGTRVRSNGARTVPRNLRMLARSR